ncbi:MAG: hypothetical protein ACI837_002635 [Crocinitomicaceae bacterium]|jgi:hypothetical protein
MKISFVLILILLVSCTSGIQMNSVRYDDLLNDGNSKIWLIDKMIIDKSDISMRNNWQKELLIFFENGHVQYLPVQDLGHKKGNIGDYVLNSNDRKLSLYFKEGVWEFDLDEITEDSIYMIPTKASDAEFSLHIIPLPEIFFEVNP